MQVRYLGRVPYWEALDLQRALATRATEDYLLLVEHPHVYTLGVRADPAHVLADPAAVGAELVVTDRGGDVTYHGPGQLVVYPVLTLPPGPGAGRQHVQRLEQVVIDALGDLGVGRAGRLEGYPGVWLDADGPEPRKVAAVGVRAARVADGRRRSTHGVAINVSPDLSMFAHIVPCGISQLPVTSLAAEGIGTTLDQVAEAVAARAQEAWSGEPVGRHGPAHGGQPVHQPADGERPLLRRLRQAGVDPDAGLPLATRKPPWLRVPARMGHDYLDLSHTIRTLGLVTVCEEAGCPNIYECWAEGTATFMVNGDRCTRACGFCLVDTRHPLALDPSEPSRVAEAVERMGLSHAVITCVARDDLPDGGAGALAATVEAIRARRPEARVEVLMSDCKGDLEAQSLVFDARPDVLNHNVETVARLQRAVRPSAGYARSLTLLARATSAGLVAKSGLMVGLGEEPSEVLTTMADLHAVGVSIVTIGQYLRPSAHHLPVARWWTPDELNELASAGRAMGLAHVEASPLTRSSYHARSAADAAGVATAGMGRVAPAPIRAEGRTDARAALPVVPQRVTLTPRSTSPAGGGR